MTQTATTPVVTRFAPSPTGYLHVGGARTALFCWLLARHSGGKYLLRIEDTDLARSTQAAVDALLEDLKWLGLQHDNTELVYQSRRLHVYNALIDTLIADGKAYKAYETPEELDARRAEAAKHKRDFVYRRRPHTAEQIAQFEAQNRPHVVRFAMPVKDWMFHDVVKAADITLPAAECQDIVIRKADGMPTYHFAVVVDDAEMQITHVLRGDEHLKNTFWHIALQEALGYPRPIYAHLPVILNMSDGKKMGKRDRDKKVRHESQTWMKSRKKTLGELASASGIPEERLSTWIKSETMQLDPVEQVQVMQAIGLKKTDLPEILVHDFRENGYLPEALLNFLALLGWNPGGDREHMTMDELSRLFTLDGVGKSGAKFDRQKLLSFNTTHNASAAPLRLLRALRNYLEVNPDSSLNRATDEQLAAILAMKPGFRTFREIDEASRFMLMSDEEITFAPDAVEKVLKKNNEGVAVLNDLNPILAEVEPWTHDSIESAIKLYCDAKQVGLGKVAQPIRVAVSGGTISPPIFHALVFLGKASTLSRITRCLSAI